MIIDDNQAIIEKLNKMGIDVKITSSMVYVTIAAFKKKSKFSFLERCGSGRSLEEAIAKAFENLLPPILYLLKTKTPLDPEKRNFNDLLKMRNSEDKYNEEIKRKNREKLKNALNKLIEKEEEKSNDN